MCADELLHEANVASPHALHNNVMEIHRLRKQLHSIPHYHSGQQFSCGVQGGSLV